MNCLRLLLVCPVLLLACGQKKLKFNFASHVKDKNCIVISCLKCDCVIGELNRIQKENSELLAGYDLFVDKHCTGKLDSTIRFTHIDQKRLDSLSTDIYNLVIIKREKDNHLSYRLVETNDAPKIEQYLKD